MTPSEKEKREEASKLHLSDAQLIAIGQVAVRSAELDMNIEATVSLLTKGIPALLVEQTNKFSTPKKLDLIEQYLSAELPAKTKEIREFISSVHNARAERDDVIHRFWIETESPETKELWALDKWPKFKQRRTVNTKWVRALADRLAAYVWTLSDWHLEARAAASSIPLSRPNALRSIFLQPDSPPTEGKPS